MLKDFLRQEPLASLALALPLALRAAARSSAHKVTDSREGERGAGRPLSRTVRYKAVNVRSFKISRACARLLAYKKCILYGCAAPLGQR